MFMFRRSAWLRRALTAVALLLAGAGLATWVQAQTSSPPAVIRACAKSNGDLYLASTGGCKNNETPISWNQQGPPGPMGPAGLQSIEVISVVATPGPSTGTFVSGTASCPAGKVALSGGAKQSTITGGEVIQDSYPVGDPPTAWTVDALVGIILPPSGTLPLTVYAVCATIAP